MLPHQHHTAVVPWPRTKRPDSCAVSRWPLVFLRAFPRPHAAGVASPRSRRLRLGARSGRCGRADGTPLRTGTAHDASGQDQRASGRPRLGL